MLHALTRLLVASPFYPHWLELRKTKQGNQEILKTIKGSVLEVGAGDGSQKAVILKQYPKIKSYMATDFSSWDEEFTRIGKEVNRFGKVAEIFMGRVERQKLDKVCSATKLPFKNNTFDWHISFEVLEHIDEPYKYFSEATRVVKPNGHIAFSVPFLYREHKLDFHRYTGEFFGNVAKLNRLRLSQRYANTGYGTTMAVLTNQWLIRRIIEGPIVLRPILLIVSPLVFLTTNVVGLLIDLKPDTRFAVRYHVLFTKRR